MSPQAVQTKPLDFSFLDEKPSYDTKLSPAEETKFAAWKKQYAPNDSGDDYDLRGAFKAGLKPDAATGHWPDTFKKPNHPTFSDESIYANDKAGHWNGNEFQPALNFDFLDAKPADKTKANDPTAQTWRELQASRFPTKAEGGDPDEVAAKPLSSILSPGGLWTQAKTAAYDLLSPLSLLRNAKSFSPGLELVRGLKTLSEDLGASRERSETAAGKAMAEGDYPVGVSKALLNMIPVVGPMVSNIADEGADPSKIAGHAEAAIFGKKVYEAAGSPLKTAGGAYRGVKNVAIDLANGKFEPHIGLMKALRPKNTNLKFSTTAEKAMKAINDTGAKPRDIHELDAATETAIHDLVGRQKAIVGNRPTKVSGKPIAAAIKKSVPKLFRHENPDVAMDIDAWADKTYDRDFTVEELDEFRKDANAKTSGYHNTKMPNQQMALDRTLDSAIAVNKANAIRETLYDGLDSSQGTGTALREVNQRIRSLLTVKDALDRRWNVELRQAAQNLPQQVSKLMAFGRVAKAAKMMVAHNPVGAAGEALVGLGEVGLADFMKELNSTNGQVASAFRRYRFKSDPLVMNPIPRAAANRALPGFTRANKVGSYSAQTVQPQTATGSTTPGNAYEGWQRQRAIQLASSTSLRDRLGRMKPANAQYHTGELPPSIRPVGRSATGQMEQVWKTALKQHTKTMKDVLHAGEEPLKRDPKTGRFLPREKK